MDDNVTPRIGMEFKSFEEAYDCYNKYGRMIGFSIRKNYLHRSTIDKTIIVQRCYVCSKEGHRREKEVDVREQRPETRTGCLARMIVKRDNDGRLVVDKFCDEHNHALQIEEVAHLLRSQRAISTTQATEIEMANRTRMGTRLTYNLMGLQGGGNENQGFTKKDLQNYLNSKRQRDLAYGDAGSLMFYLDNQRNLNPAFVYSVQMDSDDKLTNIFWADPQMQCDYQLFGDVVVFDTTFCTNKENRPLVVFVGFNHHRTLVIFGAALLYDETVESFEWLFRTFFGVNGEKKPKTIFTDQDAAMTRALTEVAPNTLHALCTWHLWQNAKKHYGYLMSEKSQFSRILYKCIYHYTEVEEFEYAWRNLRENHGIVNSGWLDRTYEIKKKWACCYLKDCFTLGVRSTQLTKSLNADLKQCLGRKLDILRFMRHFKDVVEAKRANELKKEFDARNEVLGRPHSLKPMLIQAYQLYTPTIFKEFLKEFELVDSHGINNQNVSNIYVEYVILKADATGSYTGKAYRVLRNTVEESLTCSCNKFESVGIICVHILRVLNYLQIMCIPIKYVLMRWRRSVRELSVVERIGREGEAMIEVDGQLSCLQRSRLITPTFLKVINQACETGVGYNILCKHVNEILKELKDVHAVQPAVQPTEHPSEENGEACRNLQLKPKESQKKGSGKRIKPWHEKTKKKRSVKLVEGQGSIEVTLPESDYLSMFEGLNTWSSQHVTSSQNSVQLGQGSDHSSTKHVSSSQNSVQLDQGSDHCSTKLGTHQMC